MPKISKERMKELGLLDDAGAQGESSWDQRLFGESNPLTQYASGFGETVLGGYLPETGIGAPQNWQEKVARGAGHGVGTAADLIGLSKIPGLGPAVVKGGSKLAQMAGASGAAGKLLGVHGLARDPGGEGINIPGRLKQGALGFGTGLILGPMSVAPGMGNPVARYAADTALFTGMGMAQGQDIGDAALTGAGMAAGMRAAGFGPTKARSRELVAREPQAQGRGTPPVTSATPETGLRVGEQEIVDSRAANRARGVGSEQALTADEAIQTPQTVKNSIDRGGYIVNDQLDTGGNTNVVPSIEITTEIFDDSGGLQEIKGGLISAKAIDGNSLQVTQSQVQKESRGSGIGTSLYSALIKEARARGFTTIFSDASLSEPVKKIWEKLGAEKVSDGKSDKPIYRLNIEKETANEAAWSQVEQDVIDRTSIRNDVAPPERSPMTEQLSGLSASSRELDPTTPTLSMFKKYNNGGSIEDLVGEINNNPKPGRATEDGMKVINQKIKEANMVKKATDGKGFSNQERETMRRTMELESTLPPDLVDAIKNPGESGIEIEGRRGGQLTDFRRQMQGFGGGGLPGDNVFDKHLVRTNEEIQLSVEPLFNDFMKLAPGNDHLPTSDRKLAGDIKAAMSDYAWGIQELEKMDLLEEGADPEEVAAIEAELPAILEEIAELRGQSNDQVDQYAEDLAMFFQKSHEILSQGRGSEKELGHRLDYYPAQTRTTGKMTKGPEGDVGLGSVFSKKNLERVLRERHESAVAPRALVDRSNENFYNPRASRRTSIRTEDRETDPNIILEQYAKTAARNIAHQQAIDYNRAITDLMKLQPHDTEGAESFINDYVGNAYNDRPVGLDFKLQDTFNSTEQGRALLSAVEQNGQAFRRATFALNTAWTMSTQWTSIMPMSGMYADVVPKAMKLAQNPEFKTFVAENLYSAKMKDKRMGRASQQGSDRGILEGLGSKSKADSVEEFAGELSRAMERATVEYTAAVMFYRADQLGLTEADKVNYMSDGVAKFQSMYDKYNRPSILNSKGISGWSPMQGFSMDFMNMNREKFGRNKIGAYKEFGGKQAGEQKAEGQKEDPRWKRLNKEQTKRFAGLLAGALVSNEITQKLFGKRNFTPLTPIPFANMLIPNRYGGSGLLYDAIENMARVPGDLVGGRPERAVGTIARQWAPGGAQIKPALDTVASLRGAHPVEIEPWEVLQSIFLGGPNRTLSGQQHYGKKGAKKKKKSSGTQGMN